MFSRSLVTRILATVSNTTKLRFPKNINISKRHASTNIVNHTNSQFMLDKVLLEQQSFKEPVSSVTEYVSRLRPFTAPAPPQPTVTTPTQVVEEVQMTSVLRKRRLKMNKHKHKKLRKRTRALRKKLGK